MSLKKYAPLLFLLAALSLISGILISKMSFLARTAISVFKKKYYYYAFMKIWWKVALLQFGILCFLLVIQIWGQHKLSKAKAIGLNMACMALSIIGLYFTYQDFRQDFSHRLAGERLHLGFYLFWISWICISVFLLWQNSRPTKDINKSPSTKH